MKNNQLNIEATQISRQVAAQLPTGTKVLMFNPFLCEFSVVPAGANSSLADRKNKVYDNHYFFTIDAVKVGGVQND